MGIRGIKAGVLTPQISMRTHAHTPPALQLPLELSTGQEGVVIKPENEVRTPGFTF